MAVILELKVLRNAITGVVLLLALLVQFLLLAVLISGKSLPVPTFAWLLAHIVSSALLGFAAALIATQLTPGKPSGIFILCFCMTLFLPFVGAIGCSVAVLVGTYYSNHRHQEMIYWQFTDNAALPFTTPIGRPMAKYDSRGFVEQLMYSPDNDDLYRKVLAASNIRAALSVSMLKRAVQHSDEKIRLTAYQTLDKQVTHLNREIQRLEHNAANMKGEEKSNTWLQIASNYWELLTLEKDEPVARKQLLEKAGVAAIKSVEILPSNRNAHFTLGRVWLMQGDPDRASIAFRKSMSLGMPEEKILPYLAEAAYGKREFKEVERQLGAIDDAFKLYPPLCHVAEYWK